MSNMKKYFLIVFLVTGFIGVKAQIRFTHFYTSFFEELGQGKDGYKFEGVQCYVFNDPADSLVPLYRYNNGKEHFYTTSLTELGGGKDGYKLERTQCYVYATQVTGTVPLYRAFSAANGSHFYTTNLSEITDPKNGYRLEEIQCYVFPTQIKGSTALYRYAFVR